MTKTATHATQSERRAELKALTRNLRAAAALCKLGKMSDTDPANELLKYYYSLKGHKILKSFLDWKKEGKTPKKGEKALLLWSSPKASKKAPTSEPSEESSTDQGGRERKEAQFYYICLFSEKQVQTI